MDFGYLKLLVALAFAERIWNFPLGCQDNGTSYKEGEVVVPAGEPCLSCVCRRGALSCNLRVCADYVEALPPGCFLVHQPKDCCPRLFCEGGFSPNGIELRTAVKMKNKVDENGCVVNGTVYGEGSAVMSWDPCEYCYCTEGGIKCVKPRCVQSFKGCKAVYEKFSCCPTHFDCKDAKVGFLTSRVKHFGLTVSGNSNSKIRKNTLRSLPGLDSKSGKEDLEASQSDQNSAPSEEKTTEEFAVTTTEEIRTEESTPSGQSESTTPSSPDYFTTLRLQTTESDWKFGKESSAVGLTEDTTTATTTYELPRTEEGGEEASEAGSGSPVDVVEAVGSRWNSSEVVEDYDAYDYGEPKLPPSLPNLVIFPFVAADAVVKDDRAELYEEIQVERTDDQEVLFKDYFSPPTRTEGRSSSTGGEMPERKQIPSLKAILSGGFVPKQPSPEPFYKFPSLMKELKEQPTTESPTKGKHTAPQMKAPPQIPDEASSSFDDNQRMDLASEDILGDNFKRSPIQSGPFSQVLQTEMAEFLLKGNSESFRKSQQTKKPVTVAYKNVVVDFYPDYSVTTIRSHSTTKSEACLNATDVSHQLYQRNPTTPVSLNILPDSVIGFFHGASTLAPPKAAQELPTIETQPSVMEEAPTSGLKESSFFEQFLNSLTESNTPAVVTFTTNNKHKYSSKIKGRISTTAKPKRGNDAASGQQKIATRISPTASHPLAGMITSSEGPSTTFHFIDRPQSTKKGSDHSLTTSPILSEIEKLAFPESANVRDYNTENKTHDSPGGASSSTAHSNPGTLLKLAGCNIYGMMYRIGKVITELSGPCVECICTDLGVQCSSLEC